MPMHVSLYSILYRVLIRCLCMCPCCIWSHIQSLLYTVCRSLSCIDVYIWAQSPHRMQFVRWYTQAKIKVSYFSLSLNVPLTSLGGSVPSPCRCTSSQSTPLAYRHSSSRSLTGVCPSVTVIRLSALTLVCLPPFTCTRQLAHSSACLPPAQAVT